jgi:hypothetical protein
MSNFQSCTWRISTPVFISTVCSLSTVAWLSYKHDCESGVREETLGIRLINYNSPRQSTSAAILPTFSKKKRIRELTCVLLVISTEAEALVLHFIEQMETRTFWCWHQKMHAPTTIYKIISILSYIFGLNILHMCWVRSFQYRGRWSRGIHVDGIDQQIAARDGAAGLAIMWFGLE